MAGSGDATVFAQESLTISVAGSGDVRYYGDAAVTQSIAGSGSVRYLDKVTPLGQIDQSGSRRGLRVGTLSRWSTCWFLSFTKTNLGRCAATWSLMHLGKRGNDRAGRHCWRRAAEPLTEIMPLPRSP